MPDEQTIFYHYTSVEALYNIVKTRTFWLANAKSSNDKTEGNFSLEDFETLLKDAYEKNGNSNEILKKIIDSPIDEEETKDLSYFILCLSSKRDNLSHWERYASNKIGICISINRNILSKCNNFFNFLYGDFFKIFNVYYDKQSLMEREFNKLKLISFDDDIKKRISDIASSDAWCGSSLKTSLFTTLKKAVKNECFSDENELRVLVENEGASWLRSIKPATVNLNSNLKFDLNFDSDKKACLEMLDSLDIEQTYFAHIRGEIRSLHHLNLRKIWGSDLIPEIMLGPNCPQGVDELRAFLDANGLHDTKITESKIPIR